MSNNRDLRKILIVLLCFTTLNASAGQAETSYKKIPRIVDTIKIDGNPRDWSGIPVFIQCDVSGVKDSSYIRVKSIKLAHNGKHLLILIECRENISDFFKNNKRRKTIIGTLCLDTDNNLNTGATDFFFKKGGFESSIEFATGINFGKGFGKISGMAGVVDEISDKELQYFLICTVSKYKDKNFVFEGEDVGSVDSEEKPEFISYRGAFIEARITFEKLGIDPDSNRYIHIMYKDFLRYPGTKFPELIGVIE